MSKVTIETPAGYELSSEEYYENRVVNAGRSTKTCAYCGGDIPKGQRHTVHKFYGDGDFPSYPTHDMNPQHGDNLQPGEKSCTQKLKEDLKLASYY
jgi:hypothetical protein